MTNKTEVQQEVEKVGDIVIHNLAVTMLDLEKSTPGFAKKTLKLKPKEHKVILQFFNTHILDTRTGRRTRECEFLTKEATVLKNIESLKTSEKNQNESFLSFANEVTEYLFKIMKEKNQKSSGSFIVLDVTMNGESLIVLLKLDPIKGVQINIETLDLLEVANMLPDTNDKIHKCALIKTNYVKGKTNLFVLDRQQTAGETSQYFLSTFLQASAIPNNNRKTIVVLEEAYEKIASKMPNLEKGLINDTIDTEFNNGASVHLPQSIENIFNKLVPEDTSDREIVINEYKDEFVNKFKTKYADYGMHFVVERDEKKVSYGSKSKQVVFKYDKALDKNEISVKELKDENKFIITIVNNEKLGFKKIIK